MARPVSVPEDEALKFYRIKNLTMPPQAFELSDLDREMSDVLSRTDMNSKEKAFQYYKALTKFRNLYKSFLTPGAEVEDEQNEIKHIDESEIAQIEEALIEKKKTEEKEMLDKREDQTLQAIHTLFDDDDFPHSPQPVPKQSPHSVLKRATPKPPQKAKPISESPFRELILNQLDQNGSILYQAVENHLKNESRKLLSISSNDVSFLLKGVKKKIPISVWATILNFLGSDKLEPLPKFGESQRQKPQSTKDIISFLFNNKIIKTEDLENFPNLASLLETTGVRKSVTPREFAPPLHGKGKKKNFSSLISEKSENFPKVKGVKVNFKKWNDCLF